MRFGQTGKARRAGADIGEEVERLRTELAKAQAHERDLEDTRKAVLNLLEDLEEDRHRIDRARQEWGTAFDRIRDPMFMHDAEFRIVRANRAYLERAGMPLQEIVGRPYWEIFPLHEGPADGCRRAMEEGSAEEELALPTGEIYRSRSFAVPDAEGRYAFSVHIMEDVTEKRRAEAELGRLTAALCQAGEGIGVCAPDMVILYANAALWKLIGTTQEKLTGQSFAVLLTPSFSGDIGTIHERTHRGSGWSGEVEIMAMDGSVIPVRLSTSPIRNGDGAVVGCVGVFTDLREVKRKEQALRRLNRTLETLSAANAQMVRAHDEIQLAQEVCEVLVKLGGHDLAWIGYAEHDEATTVRPIARAGRDQELVDQLRVTWGGAKEERGPTGTAIYTSRPVICQDLGRDRQFAPWLAEVLARGFRSAIVLPIAVRGQTLGAIHIYSVEPNAFDRDEVRLLVELADDLAFGLMAVRDRHNRIKAEHALKASERRLRTIIDNEAEGVVVLDEGERILFVNPAAEALLGRRRKALSGIEFALPPTDHTPVELELVRPDGSAVVVEVRSIKTDWFGQPAYIVSLQDITERKNLEEERQRSAERLQSRLVETIEAMGLAVEKRDPYTAGHQRRVANLVEAIACELGLDKERIEGMRLGATIHDIGKIFVPAEILNRPGQLSKIEYAIVLTHPEAGYDIVKGIEFPWPVADMILQHHERLDGSGYPRGLKGDQINREARILAVADVVEAIASHRPYRPSLGLKAALTEITANRGTLYDPEVVDACIRVLKARGYERAVS